MATAIHHATPHAHTEAITAAAVPMTGSQQRDAASAVATSGLGLSECFMNAR